MPAYMVNEYYVFTSYEDLTSLIHDIIHHSLLPTEQDHYSFSIMTGELHPRALEFQSDTGQFIALRYEREDNLYYSA